jgi:hypothetical protein
MGRISRWSSSLAVLAVLVIAGGRAEALTLTANMTTDQETTVPALTTVTGDSRPTPSGFATFVLNSAQTEAVDERDDLRHRRDGPADARRERQS